MIDLDKLAARQTGMPSFTLAVATTGAGTSFTRHLDVPTLNDHMPGVLGELFRPRIKSDQTIPESLCDSQPSGSWPTASRRRI